MMDSGYFLLTYRETICIVLVNVHFLAENNQQRTIQSRKSIRSIQIGVEAKEEVYLKQK